MSVQVFLHDDTPAENLAQVARDIIADAKKKIGHKAEVELGKVHQLAKSFSIQGDLDAYVQIGQTGSLSPSANVA